MFVAGCYFVKSVVRILLTKLLFKTFTCHISTLGEKPCKTPRSVDECDWCAIMCKFYAVIVNATIIFDVKDGMGFDLWITMMIVSCTSTKCYSRKDLKFLSRLVKQILVHDHQIRKFRNTKV